MFHAKVNIQPYIMYQEIFVYYNGDCIYEDNIILKDIVNNLEKLNEQYNLNHVEVYGPTRYTKHFANLIEDKVKIPVEVIERRR